MRISNVRLERTVGCISKLTILLGVVWFILCQLGCGDKPRELALAPLYAAQGLTANIELRTLQNQLVLYAKANERLLSEEQFPSYVQENFTSNVKNPLEDPWGRNYRYALIPGGFALGSAGPDGRFQTGDDLVLNWRKEPRIAAALNPS